MLGWRIQEIAEQIQAKRETDDDNNEINLLLWRSSNSQVRKNFFFFLTASLLAQCTTRTHLHLALLVYCTKLIM